MDHFVQHATRSLPENYVLRVRFSARDQRTMLAINAAGFVLLFLFGWLFIVAALWLRPEDTTAVLSSNWGGWKPLAAIIGVLLLSGITIYLHEAIHGLGFWLATRTRPVFGMRSVYAYAAAPEWYIPRDPYLLIGLAPLLSISIIGIFLIAFVPGMLIGPILVVLVMNASGAVGDLWVAVLLLRQPADALACDSGEEVKIYAPVH